MKRILFALLATCSFSLFAATWIDPDTNIEWTYTVSNGMVTVGRQEIYGTGYRYYTAIPKSTTGEVVIPDTIGGAPVTAINEQAFYYCTGLTAITIPKSVTSIGNSAFVGCTGLTSITIPSGVTSIGGSAFWRCSNLTTVEIPDSVKDIGGGAFGDCTSLTSFKIPKSLEILVAFLDGTGVTSIVIPENVGCFNQSAFAGTSIKEIIFEGAPPELFTRNTANNYFPATLEVLKYKRYPELWKRTYNEALSKTLELANTYLHNKWALSVPWIYIGRKVKVVSSFGGNVIDTSLEGYTAGDKVTISAMPKEGYIFLGWSSDIEGISGTEETLTFTMPEQEEVTVVASFFPKAVLTAFVNETLNATLDEKVDARIEAKIDGESLLTAEQAATKTSATIEAKVADGELITSEQLQVMAMEAPVIAVEEGVAKVGVSLKSAASLDGEWTQVEAEEAEVMDDGAISVSVPADEKAAFYKFVVPNKQ